MEEKTNNEQQTQQTATVSGGSSSKQIGGNANIIIEQHHHHYVQADTTVEDDDEDDEDVSEDDQDERILAYRPSDLSMGCLGCEECRRILRDLVHNCYVTEERVMFLDTLYGAVPQSGVEPEDDEVRNAYEELKMVLEDYRDNDLAVLERFSGVPQDRLREILKDGWELPGNFEAMFRPSCHAIVDARDEMALKVEDCPYYCD